MTTKLMDYARRLRENSTDAERLFWSRVRDRRLSGFKFKRQYATGSYIVDFACTKERLIVELDGGQHAGSEVDKERDAQLASDGYRVLRFWNNDVLMNIDGVIETVLKNLRRPSPQPSPGTGRGLG
jgi:very-short-patch-repair endonuclease